MPDFDAEAFITKLDRMGMKLTAVPLADGKLRINRWRMLDACDHTQQIQDLWSTQIGNDQERIDVLAAYLDKAAPKAAGYSTGPDRMRISSHSIAVPDAATGSHTVTDSRRAATSQFGVTLQKRPDAQTTVSVPAMAASQLVVRPGLGVGTSRSEIMQTALDRLKPAGPEGVSGVHGAAGLQKVAGTASSGSLQNAIAHISMK